MKETAMIASNMLLEVKSEGFNMIIYVFDYLNLHKNQINRKN